MVSERKGMRMQEPSVARTPVDRAALEATRRDGARRRDARPATPARLAGGDGPVRARAELAALFGLPSVLFVAVILLLPLVALVYRTLGSGVFLQSLGKPIVVQALRLSAWTSLVTVLLAVALGTPLAYGLARARFPGKRAVDTLVDLPIVLPPVVAVPGVSLSFSTAAVILAQLFVAAPFFIRAARAGFATTDREIEEAAAIDGASPWQTFRLVTVPLALPALSSGLVLCWARAVGAFGATMMFAGNFAGRTQTMPLAIMAAMESDLYAALALAVLLVALSFAVLLLYRLIGGRRGIEL